MPFSPELPPHALLHYKDFDWVCSMLDGICEHMERRLPEGFPGTLKEYAMLFPFRLYAKLQGVEVGGPYAEDWRAFQKGDPLPSTQKWLAPKRDCVLDEASRIAPEDFLARPSVHYKKLLQSPAVTKRARALGVELWGYSARKGVVYRPAPCPACLLRDLLADLPDPLVIASCRPARRS